MPLCAVWRIGIQETSSAGPEIPHIQRSLQNVPQHSEQQSFIRGIRDSISSDGVSSSSSSIQDAHRPRRRIPRDAAPLEGIVLKTS